jgi:hypothetical protein
LLEWRRRPVAARHCGSSSAARASARRRRCIGRRLGVESHRSAARVSGRLRCGLSPPGAIPPQASAGSRASSRPARLEPHFGISSFIPTSRRPGSGPITSRFAS